MITAADLPRVSYIANDFIALKPAWLALHREDGKFREGFASLARLSLSFDALAGSHADRRGH